MDVLINSLIVCFGVGFISSLQIWILYRLSYIQLQMYEAQLNIQYAIDLLNQIGPEDEHQPDMGAGYASGIHNTTLG